MGLDGIKGYKSLIIDYSIIREFSGTALFSELLDYIVDNQIDIYVSKAFKLFHYCVIHQADSKYTSAASAMKDFCSVLLPIRKLHSIQAIDTVSFLNEVSVLEESCVVATANSIFYKRLYERRPDYKGDICVLTANDATIYHGTDDFVLNHPQKEISPLASVNKYLDAPVFCNVGDTVMTGEKKPLELVKRVSSGAEGMVFTTNNPRIVAKIYHKNIITPLRWSKLSKMVSMGINSIGICWPQSLLFFKGVPVGYTMILGKGKTLGNILDGPDAIMDNFPEWRRVDVVDTLISLLEKYIYLHMHDIIAGDIQLKNSLLYSSNSVYLIDMDSVQVGNLPCPVGTEEFTDPRLWDNNFADFLRKLEDEDYSIAMLVFSCLFCGLHPYATRNGAETLREEILAKNFPYTIDNSSEEHIPKGGYNYIWTYLPEYLRKMLYESFKLGKRFEAVEWYSAVLTYKEELTTHAYDDEESYKVFPKMSYFRTPEAVSKTSDSVATKTFTKQKFSGVNSSSVYQPDNVFTRVASSNTGITSSVFANSNSNNSPFVSNKPAEPSSSTETSNEVEAKDNKGKGLFGGIFKK